MVSLIGNVVKSYSSFAKEGFRDFHNNPVPVGKEGTQ